MSNETSETKVLTGYGHLHQVDLTIGKKYEIITGSEYHHGPYIVDDIGDWRSADAAYWAEPLVETENPKAGIGADKAPFFGVPSSALVAMGNVMAGGALKYGAFNYRDTRIAVSTYHDAILRHFHLYMDGEDCDPLDTTPPGSGVSHLAHIMACCALMIDAAENGMLDDDRSKTGKVRIPSTIHTSRVEKTHKILSAKSAQNFKM